jgi:hypothetical protein
LVPAIPCGSAVFSLAPLSPRTEEKELAEPGGVPGSVEAATLTYPPPIFYRGGQWVRVARKRFG